MPQTTTATASGYRDFLPIALQIVNTPPSRARRALGYLVCGTITIAILWSIFGSLRLFAIAPGEFVARGGNQVVEPLEAGQVSSIPVQNGSHVAAGAVVLQLDPTAADASEAIAAAKLTNARAEAFRRSSAAFLARSGATEVKAPLAWPPGIPADVVGREETVLRADLNQLRATLADLAAKLKTEQATATKLVGNISAQKTLVDSRTKRSAMHQTLAEQGWDSRAIVLQSLEPLRQDEVHLADYQGQLAEANAAIPVLEDQMKAARESFIAENVAASAVAQREASTDEQQLAKAKMAVANLAVRAPVAGTVQGLAVTSLGQSIKAGEMIMQVVPDKAPLEIKAYVLNTDIGFVRVGQPVTVKVDTFMFTRYGTVSGRVVSVGADAVTGQLALTQQSDDATTPSSGGLSVTNAAQEMKDLVFPVTIAPDRTSLTVNGRDVPLTAGMSVVAEIE
ncbi:HlyD family type I secretion periplasmic adaptor subunit, partial [Sphingomonas sp.]|uniref:HlyD family type I secretion periplasmic adaptor subunit n=1 Tax=Sphingomonas sp. TaxID=28214 RepID=UPI0025FD6E29